MSKLVPLQGINMEKFLSRLQLARLEKMICSGIKMLSYSLFNLTEGE